MSLLLGILVGHPEDSWMSRGLRRLIQMAVIHARNAKYLIGLDRQGSFGGLFRLVVRGFV
jgi:hypothetical protein